MSRPRSPAAPRARRISPDEPAAPEPRQRRHPGTTPSDRRRSSPDRCGLAVEAGAVEAQGRPVSRPRSPAQSCRREAVGEVVDGPTSSGEAGSSQSRSRGSTPGSSSRSIPIAAGSPSRCAPRHPASKSAGVGSGAQTVHARCRLGVAPASSSSAAPAPRVLVEDRVEDRALGADRDDGGDRRHRVVQVAPRSRSPARARRRCRSAAARCLRCVPQRFSARVTPSTTPSSAMSTRSSPSGSGRALSAATSAPTPRGLGVDDGPP